jgi:hypothetical protein
MDIANYEIWLLLLMKKNITFDDINAALNKINEPIGKIFDLKLPKPIANLKFKYPDKNKHQLFHLILDDLDLLCKRGEATRAYELNGKEIEERFKISPKGELRAAQLTVAVSTIAR